jgi:hypothetical protein
MGGLTKFLPTYEKAALTFTRCYKSIFIQTFFTGTPGLPALTAVQ